jgi:hypothetical protein
MESPMKTTHDLHAVTSRSTRPAGTRIPRALVWDSNNSSSLLAARSFVQAGWQVDWLGFQDSPWQRAVVWNSRQVVGGFADPALERILAEHPLDALLLHGDDQVRWMLAHWQRLPQAIHRNLPPAGSLETTLSKHRSLEFVRGLGIPVLDSVACASRDEVVAASERLGPHVVLKGEGGAAGSSIVGLRAGQRPSEAQWHAVTCHGPKPILQKRIAGPRALVTVAYEHGVERAAVAHEKSVAYPPAFGPCAFGITRRYETVHAYAEKIFAALQWHGVADIEFRQDAGDGRWYFMEINPRVCATLGIQASAGLDVMAAWARICAGRGAENPAPRSYREGVPYAWGTRALALAMRQPWRVPAWGARCLLSDACDLDVMDADLRRSVLRTAFWLARHE